MRDGFSPLAVVVFGAMAAAVFVIVDRLRSLTRTRGFSGRSDAYVESVLRKWLDKEDYATRTINTQAATMQFSAEDQKRRRYTIIRPHTVPEFLLIGGVWSISTSDQAKLRSLSNSATNELLKECKLALLALGVAYDLQKYPEQIGVECRIARDETCTQERFLERLSNAAAAYNTISVLLEAAANSPATDDSSIPPTSDEERP